MLWFIKKDVELNWKLKSDTCIVFIYTCSPESIQKILYFPPPPGYTLTSLRDDIESGSKTAAAARGAKSFENLGRDFLLLGGKGGGVWERELKCGTF